MQIIEKEISQIIFDPNNARKHDQKNLDAIKGSLTKFGQQKPVVINKKNIVIAGNGTLEAARALGWEKINVVVTELDEFSQTAYALADNRSAELAAWDDELLGKTLQALREDGFDIGDIGFDVGDFFDDESKEGLTDPDEVPEVPQNVRGVERGQIWQLGEHRIMCGDSTSKEDVERLMGGEKEDMVFTDPPYGIAFSNDSLPKKDFKGVRDGLKHNKYKIIEGDYTDFDPSFLLESFPGAREVFIWGAHNYPDKLPRSTWIVWDRKLNESADGNLAGDFDLCWSREKHKMAMCRIPWFGVFGHSKKDDGDKKVHPTMKPVKLAEWFFGRWGKPSDLVVDLFLGSGSTLIACEKTNRKCFGMEIDPHYCSVIIERWEKFTGKQAKLL